MVTIQTWIDIYVLRQQKIWHFLIVKFQFWKDLGSKLSLCTLLNSGHEEKWPGWAFSNRRNNAAKDVAISSRPYGVFSLRQMILDHQMSIMQREMKLTLNNGMLFQTVAGLFQIVALQIWLERAINKVLTFPTLS